MLETTMAVVSLQLSMPENAEQHTHLIHEVDEYPGWQDPDQLSLPSLMIRLVLAIMLPMWTAIVLSSFLFVTIRMCLTAQDLRLDFTVEAETPNTGLLSHAQFIAVPALFGPRFSGGNAELLAVTGDACTPETAMYNITKRFVLDLQLNDGDIPIISDANLGIYSDSPTLKAALVERGGCSFDQKIYTLQEQGFDLVIVYNYAYNPDIPIRIALKAMIEAEKDAILGVVIKKTAWGLNSSAMKEILQRTLKRTIHTSVPLLMLLSLALSLTLIKNRTTSEDFGIRQTLEFILFEQPTAHKKLKKIIFPAKILSEADLVDKSWAEGGVGIRQGCAICIEEFKVGDSTRELPCRHTFHDVWYYHLTSVDPWLLGFQRVCPICKRDVIDLEAE